MSADEEPARPGGKAVPGPENRERRRFLGALGGLAVVWAGAGLYPVYRYLSPQPPPDPFGQEGRAPVEKITPADVARNGTGRNGGYAGRGLIVLRDEAGRLRAFDSKCTHAGCNVEFQGTKLYCNCHGGVYDLAGRNVAGPPPKPLTELKVFEDQGALYVARLDEPAGG